MKEGTLRKQSTDMRKIRILLTAYYFIICALAYYRLWSVVFETKGQSKLSNLDLAVYVGFILVSLVLFPRVQILNDRIAVLLYGIYYAIRIAANFTSVSFVGALLFTECAVLSAGTVALIVSLIRVIANERLTPSPNTNSGE